MLLQLDDRDETLAVELATVKLADAERLVTRYTTVNARDANIPESQLDDARAAVDSARIALEQARVDLDRRRIAAPFAGRVGITEIDGDRIDTNTLVTTIDDRSLLLVNFSVPEVYVDRVTRGTPVDVRLWDAADAPVSGEIVAVDSRIDINSRAFMPARRSITPRIASGPVWPLKSVSVPPGVPSCLSPTWRCNGAQTAPMSGWPRTDALPNGKFVW